MEQAKVDYKYIRRTHKQSRVAIKQFVHSSKSNSMAASQKQGSSVIKNYNRSQPKIMKQTKQ
ncbi:hypothetical protein COLO4_07405 [Corchorus olitorius]|uniref:Uncharacterized protein n=1 Tax=Corchorus olitorius TaxID=93759 RepID=A0A1R3KJS9_9ROSI|nr:hypothetical protein COLO4_07405 [Corchorus olitorius]